MKPSGRQNTGFDAALAHHRAGRLQQAEAAYRKVIEKAPEHAQALFLQGAICLASQRAEEALALSRRAAALYPDNALYLSNLGEAQRRLGHLEEAAEVLVRAVTLRPELPEASFNLAMTLLDLGQVEAALTCLVRAADVAPERFEIQYRLAHALVSAGALDRAVPHFQAALALNGQSLEALLEVSAVLRSLKRSDGAVAMALRAVTLAPTSARAQCELGHCCAAHERAKDIAQALARFREAIRLDPQLVDAHFGLGSALVELGAPHEGLECFRAVVRLSPAHAVAASNIAYLSVFDPTASPEQALRAAEDYAQTHAAPLAKRWLPHQNERSPERRLRVGYVGIFQEHATAYFLTPLLSHHDPQRFEVYGYAINERQDATTARLGEHLTQLRDVSTLTHAETAALIRADRIDVLVDFNMHMANSRLLAFAEKPAPVQICWLAYPGTTGLKAIDYRITDASMDPEGAAHSLYTERSLCLPGPFWCYDPLTEHPARSEPPAFKNGYVTFGSLNAFWKTNPDLFALWSRVLAAVPDSHFILYAPNAEAERLARAAFAAHGIAAPRIHCVPARTRVEYLAGYADLDVALDTLPYSGHTTTLDALWMGVPVVTMLGQTAAGRAGLSVMRAAGLPDLVTETELDFVARAQRLALDLPGLSALRAGLRERLRSSPAMDGARFTQHFEAALRSAWQAWCSDGSDGSARSDQPTERGPQ